MGIGPRPVDDGGLRTRRVGRWRGRRRAVVVQPEGDTGDVGPGCGEIHEHGDGTGSWHGGRMPWSVWAKKGVSEPIALEDGGVVFSGRWYGLCPGFPNVFEMDLANLGPQGPSTSGS